MHMKPIYVIPLAVIVVLIIADQIARKRSIDKATRLYASGRFSDLVDYLDSWYPRLFYMSYIRQRMKFKAFEAMGKTDLAEDCLDLLFASSPAKAQLADLLIQAFTFYMSSGKFKKAEEILARIEENPDLKDAAPELRKVYEIQAKGDSSHIEEMETQVSKASGADALRLYLLIAKQYENKGDNEKADFYRAKAKHVNS